MFTLDSSKFFVHIANEVQSSACKCYFCSFYVTAVYVFQPLNPAPESQWSQYFADNEMLLQIDKDCRLAGDKSGGAIENDGASVTHMTVAHQIAYV